MTIAFLNHCIAPRLSCRGSWTGKFTLCFALLLFGAFAGSAFAKSSPDAPLVTLTYDDGDLFLGFRATDRTSDYLINIGQPGQLLSVAPGGSIAVDVGTPSTDLVNVLGSDWYTRIDVDTGNSAVQWSVTGGRQVAASGDPANVLYSTNPGSIPWPSRSDTAQSFTTSLISALGNTFAGNQSTANNPKGLIQGVTSSNSYASFQPGGANSGGISFQAWNPKNEAAPDTGLFFNRIAPGTCATSLGTFSLSSSGVLTFTATLTPAPVSLSGAVTNCSSPTTPPVPNVTLTLTGSMSGSTLSDGSGGYTFSSLPSGGNFVVTPTKTALSPGSGINTQDVLAVQRHFLGTTIIPAGCRLTAADAVVNGSVNTQDVLAVQRFFLGFATGIGSAGQYKFTPASVSYSPLFCNRSSQNFSALVVGDAAAPYNLRPGGPSPDGMSAQEAAATVAEVALPDVEVDPSLSNFVLQVTTTNINAKDNLVGFQGDFAFDERVIAFQDEPVQKAGITRGNWNVSGNVLPGNGPVRTLRVSAFSNDLTPLFGTGTLFELRVARVSKAGQGTQLIWAAPPDHFIFIDADLNAQSPSLATLGGVTIEKAADNEAAPETFNK